MKRLALILFGLIAVLLASYQPPPWFAKRLYIFPSSDSTPFDPTGVYRDTLNYRLGGYFALFGTDTSYSLRIWPGVATGRGLTFRQVSGTGDTTRIDSVGIYTSGRVTGTHYGDGSNLTGISGSGTVTSVKCSLGVTATTNPITSTGTVYVDTPTVHGWVTSWSSSGSTDSIQRGVWLGSGWLKNDSTANVDSGAVGTWGDLRWLGLLGKAADATGADSADVGVVSRSCTGNAATATNATTADSSTGGATRATTAATLQGKDTTAMHTYAGRDSAKVQVGDTVRATRLKTAFIQPPADSVQALQIFKADGTTSLFCVDSRNSGISVGAASTGPGAMFQLKTNTNPSLWLVNTGVTHPFTNVGFIPEVNTNVSGSWVGAQSSNGGMQLNGFMESGATDAAVQLNAHLGSATPTIPSVSITGWKTNGSTGRTALTTTERVLSVRSGATEILVVTGGGAVAIDTSAPRSTEKLFVKGRALVSGQSQFDSLATFQGPVRFAGSAPWQADSTTFATADSSVIYVWWAGHRYKMEEEAP